MYKVFITDFRIETRLFVNLYTDKRVLKNSVVADIEKFAKLNNLKETDSFWDFSIVKIEGGCELELSNRDLLEIFGKRF